MSAIDPKSGRFRTRADIASDLLERALHAVFTDKIPADRFLKRHFHAERRIGARDRRLYAGLIFGVLRWFGPLHRAFAECENACAFYLAAAAAAERLNDPACECFFADAGLSRADFQAALVPETPLDRLKVFHHLVGADGDVTMRQCFPDWVFAHCAFTPDAGFFRLEQTRSPLWLRVRHGDEVEQVLAALENAGIAAFAHDQLKTALQIPGSGVNLAGVSGFRTGAVEVQDLSSQCVGQVCAPARGECWWDVCAGSGGKSLHLASLMCGGGAVFASEVRASALAKLKRRAATAKLFNIRPLAWDGSKAPERLAGRCAGALVDAPCSSSGRWRRNPESRWTLAEEDLAKFAARQQKILDLASGAVKPGGALVYATCSLFRDENDEVAEGFLSAHPEFRLDAFRHPLTGAACPGTAQILPGDGDCDAAFIARFRKSEA